MRKTKNMGANNRVKKNVVAGIEKMIVIKKITYKPISHLELTLLFIVFNFFILVALSLRIFDSFKASIENVR